MPRLPDISRDIRMIRSSFIQIAHSFGRLGPLLAVAASASLTPAETAGKPARRRLRLFLARRRARILQGCNMGTLRGLTPEKRAQVKRIRAEKGVRAAIREARRLAG